MSIWRKTLIHVWNYKHLQDVPGCASTTGSYIIDRFGFLSMGQIDKVLYEFAGDVWDRSCWWEQRRWIDPIKPTVKHIVNLVIGSMYSHCYHRSTVRHIWTWIWYGRSKIFPPLHRDRAIIKIGLCSYRIICQRRIWCSHGSHYSWRWRRYALGPLMYWYVRHRLAGHLIKDVDHKEHS